MTVLTLLIVAVGQIVRGTTAVTTGNRQRLDADEQARLVFDRMGLDFSRMLKRQDVDYLLSRSRGNDTFFFYTEAPAYFDSTAANTGTTARVRSRSSATAWTPPCRKIHAFAFGQGPHLGRNRWLGPGGVVFLSPSSAPSINPTPTPDPASTLAGHWSTTIGTAAANYTDGVDDNINHVSNYHVIAIWFAAWKSVFCSSRCRPPRVRAPAGRLFFDPL